jgi:hypothetical protein
MVAAMHAVHLVRFVDSDPSTVAMKLLLPAGEEPPGDPDDDTGIASSLDPGPLPIKVCACMHVVYAGCACSVCYLHARMHSCVRE